MVMMSSHDWIFLYHKVRKANILIISSSTLHYEKYMEFHVVPPWPEGLFLSSFAWNKSTSFFSLFSSPIWYYYEEDDQDEDRKDGKTRASPSPILSHRVYFPFVLPIERKKVKSGGVCVPVRLCLIEVRVDAVVVICKNRIQKKPHVENPSDPAE